MTRLIRVEDIEEFEKAHGIPRSAINDVILSRIRDLREKEELETYLREIISDKTETPHNPTEIADILTTVTIEGQPLLTAFVNKGRGIPSVTAKNTSHQIVRLRRMPGLNLIVFVAVGHIQDDLKADLVQVAQDTNAHYAILDAVDVARLFIAYYKICPMDGTPNVNGVCPKCGNEADGPITLIITVNEDAQHNVLEHRDVSHGMAKRYVADVWSDRHYTKPTLKKVIKKVMEQLRNSNVYGSQATESRFGNRPADVVWIFLYFDEFDRQTHNWYCRAQWISPKLPKQNSPMRWEGEKFGEIVIDWRKDYEVQRKFWLDQQGDKQEWIQKIETVFPQMETLINQARTWLNRYEQNEINAQIFEQELSNLEQMALEVSSNAGNTKLPPLDCKECDQLFQNMAAQCHNVFLPFATWGKITECSLQQKLWLVRNSLQGYETNLQQFKLQWRKFRS